MVSENLPERAAAAAPWFGSDGIEILNNTDVPTDVLRHHLAMNPEVAALTRWAQGIASPHAREGGLLERDKYVTPFNIYDQMRVAYEAGEEDDVVANVLESTESLAFGGISMDANDPDEEDIWNQVIDDIDLDTRLREMWRELFLCSQFYCVCWWGKKDYKVRGTSKDTGVKRKKTFKSLNVPLGISILDPMKVLPVGNLMFNQEQLVYIAVPGEAQQFERVLSQGLSDDTIVSQLITGKYQPTHHERVRITQLGLPADHLYFLNPDLVFRHTLTRPQYQRFANVRMRSVFELLDLKRQLRAMDRAFLLGATNFLIVVTKGTDKLPATAAEIMALSGSVKTIGKIPIIVGDHRLKVEIITPDIQYVLNDEKWSVLDTRIAARLYQMFTVGSSTKTGGRDDSLKLARVVARGMESRRMLLKKALERQIFKAIYERNPDLNDMPTLNFHPRRISLDFDPAVATFLQDLRDRGDLSRESILQELDFDQVQEARNREREAKYFDEIFETQNPWGGTPAGGDPSQQTMNQNPAVPGGARPAGGAGAGAKPAAAKPKPDPAIKVHVEVPQPTSRRTATRQAAKTAQNPKTSGRALGGNHQGGGARGGAQGQGKTKPGTGKS